ncbi:hypothetical protein SKAU_G00273310 [Synaphobranchus kaupii]|uniref:BCL-6 corepressor PCGF1 binding domain-containing protein n=1 Tax=Synaphobranchus kaupii TaxID=118154 RepID=A0A9Q1F0P5_SYNKA|nr:hypothetical protein SKAU_G00273310 [Synaphobranchus kaupii]
MVSASPLCSSVRGWVSTDHIPLCNINEDRVSYTEDSPSVKLQSSLCKECGVNSEHMQVDPTHMKVGDGGAVSVGGGTPSGGMVGNPPPKTLPLEQATDVNRQSKPAQESDFKSTHVSSKSSQLQHCLEGPPCLHYDSAPLLRTVPVHTAPHEKAEIPKHGIEGAVTHARQQRLIGKGDNVPPDPSPSNPGKRAPAQIQSVISLSPGFQCSTHFKPGQPVAFFPAASLSPPLCKITLPPALGQIAALREATANQFSKLCHLQSSNSGGTPQLQPYPYHFSIGRVITPESKPSSTVAKHTCGPVACSKSSKVGKDYDSSSPTIAVPSKQPTLGSAPMPTLSLPPSSQGGCSPTVASFTAHSRLINHVEKHPSRHSLENTSVTHARLKSPGVADENAVACLAEVRDMPLDLSAKSNRQKSTAAPPKTSQTELCSTEVGKKDTTSLKRAPCAQASGPGPSAPYSIFPETLRNGALPKNSTNLLNHHGAEASASWAKISSQGSINLPGTYVGVASPVLASTLRSKDGKGTPFVEDLQSTAKQETISIIDQGERLVCRGRKGPAVVKDPQKCPISKHSSDIRPPGQPKDVFPLALSGPAKSHTYCTLSSGNAVIPQSPNGSKPAWCQRSLLPHQGASALQRKNSHGAPQSQVDSGNEGVPFQNPFSNAPRVKEEKLDKSKSPLSNLESIVKQKALETSELPSDRCPNLATLDTKGSEAVEHIGCHDTTSRLITSGEFPLINSSKKREWKRDKDLQGGVHTRVSCKQEKRIATELREKIPEKRLKQEENSGSNDCSNTSRLSIQTQSFGDGGPHDKNKKKTKLICDTDEDNTEARSVAESVSPCVKLEGIGFSILKGQCTDVTELKEKTSGAKDMKDVLSKARAPVNKCKKLSSSKNDKLSTETLRETVACTKKSQKESPVTKQAKKQKKQPIPGLELSQPEAEEGKRKRGGRGSIASAEQLSHSQAAGVSSDFTAPRSLQQSTPGRPKKEGECATPRLRRGRRPKEEVLQDNRSPPPPPPPPTPSPSTPFRRPRGRPRSNPLPDQVQGGVATPAHGGNTDSSAGKKRRRRRNRKYQNGEYIVEREQARAETDEKCVTTRQAARAEADLRTTGVYPRQSATLPCLGTSPEGISRRAFLTRSGSRATPEPSDKPSGKRKFKSKHLCDTEEDKLKIKRSRIGKRSSPVADVDSPPTKRLHSPGSVTTPKGLSSPPTNRRGSRGGASESSPIRPIPPEVRRLIVNKNAGETLLQRAARLGYQEVVLYCLEKDVREVNRRDNAGYTALHEACSRGWAHIVRVLLDHGADVNCSAQDGTRPIHDAVVNDSLTVVWMLLNHGADPTLATYSGQTALKLAHSNNMKKFLMEYFADLDGREEQDPGLCWDFYSSAVFETEEKTCWDFLLSLPKEEEAKDEERKEREERTEGDCFLFEFSAEPLLPCYHIQVSLAQGFCNWFLLPDVLRRVKMSARIFRARYPHFEVVGISRAELRQQASVSQVTPVPGELQAADGEGEGPVELVRCVPDLQGLLGSTVQILEEVQSSGTVRLHSR